MTNAFNAPVQNNDPTDLFGNNNQAQPEQQEQSDWANMDAFGDSSAQQTQQLPNDFAKLPMETVLQATQPGKQGKSGVQV